MSSDLEAQTSAAHRAYIDALMAWEQLVDAKKHASACDAAEMRKEACRVTFRDLVEQLGYLPRLTDS